MRLRINARSRIAHRRHLKSSRGSWEQYRRACLLGCAWVAGCLDTRHCQELCNYISVALGLRGSNGDVMTYLLVVVFVVVVVGASGDTDGGVGVQRGGGGLLQAQMFSFDSCDSVTSAHLWWICQGRSSARTTDPAIHVARPRDVRPPPCPFSRALPQNVRDSPPLFFFPLLSAIPPDSRPTHSRRINPRNFSHAHTRAPSMGTQVGLRPPDDLCLQLRGLGVPHHTPHLFQCPIN